MVNKYSHLLLPPRRNNSLIEDLATIAFGTFVLVSILVGIVVGCVYLAYRFL